MRTTAKTMLVLVLAAAAFAWIHRLPILGDPDAFYHLKMSELLLERGPVGEFIWLPFTTLARAYADHHFLYHLLLAPYVAALGPLLGLKAATVAFAVAAIAAFLLLLRRSGVRHAGWFALLLVGAYGPAFRLSLSKASSLSIAVVLLALVLLRRRGSAWTLFALSFAFVWLHGAWPVMLGLLAIAVAADLITSAIFAQLSKNGSSTAVGRGEAPAVVGGLAAGLVLNPFFPANLTFYWEQIFQIALVNYASALGKVGAEWGPGDLGRVFTENAAALLPLLTAVALLVWIVLRRGSRPGDLQVSRERLRDVVTALLLSAAFLVMTMRHARHQEYLVPLVLWLAALLFDTVHVAAFKDHRARVAALAVLAISLGLGAWNVARLASFYKERHAFAKYAGAAAWIRANVPEGQVIFHGRWDDFPMLFYRDDAHRYVAGLDPTFFWRQDPVKYQLWDDIGSGRRRAELPRILKSEFSTDVVFVRAEGDPLKRVIEKNPSFKRVYADSEAEVWRVR
jgi:hypothetical protein